MLDGSGAGTGVNGLTINSDNNVIGGLRIKSFSGDGILITGANNALAFGCGSGSTQVIQNVGYGVHISGEAADGNSLLSVSSGSSGTDGNSKGGVRIDGGADNTTTTSNGCTGPLGVRGNLGPGITISDPGTTGNSMDVDVGGTYPNQGHGVLITNGANNTSIRGTIQNNTGDGFRVESGNGNRFSGSTGNNGGLGINLVAPGDPANGVTPNDPGDADTGPNDLLNFPVIQSVTGNSGNYTVSGTACSNCSVTLYTSTNDASGHGEGIPLNSINANASGNWSTTLQLLPGTNLTATATDSFGNMSDTN